MVDEPADTPMAWADALPPTCGAALARIARVRPAAYARTRNHLDGAVTGLSPYLTHGLVTQRDVLAGVLQREPLPVQHKLVFELGWREFFRHVWARYAPVHWHSPGSVLDQSYEALDRMARDARVATASADIASTVDGVATPEPPLLTAPPPDLGLRVPDAATADRLRGREVWLVHPWALRAPPPDLADGAVVIGLYLREHHQAWPWPAARWHWVDAAMTAVASERWTVDAAHLAGALAGAARVRSVDDSHVTRQLQPVAQLDAAPIVFPSVERHCASFSQWWTRATRGLQRAEDLL
ncbi:deoxyribodipyrimidine photolyase [uncultured Lamprocystis sp.]|uniref:deoxyribodipyrimidine photolyase n=1 Tax=uncultured Lamprocystis sp. TaxID=543132 RepID=UPI0025D7CEF1|nr:deoxyribodipyrimidine photolyase [uncultured Lamprocystis sp.]